MLSIGRISGSSPGWTPRMPDELNVIELVEQEITNRLKTNPGEVPAGALFKFFELKQRKELEGVKEDIADAGSPLDWIEGAGLPDDRRKSLLVDEITRLEEE